MIGLSRQEIEERIKGNSPYVVNNPITPTDLKRVLNSVVEGIAEAIEENNKKIEREINRIGK